MSAIEVRYMLSIFGSRIQTFNSVKIANWPHLSRSELDLLTTCQNLGTVLDSPGNYDGLSATRTSHPLGIVFAMIQEKPLNWALEKKLFFIPSRRNKMIYIGRFTSALRSARVTHPTVCRLQRSTKFPRKNETGIHFDSPSINLWYQK